MGIGLSNNFGVEVLFWEVGDLADLLDGECAAEEGGYLYF